MTDVTSEIKSNPYNKMNLCKGELKQPSTLQSSQHIDPPSSTSKHIVIPHTAFTVGESMTNFIIISHALSRLSFAWLFNSKEANL